MQFDEGKQKFIEAWGTLGSNWGINKTMAQVHALLLASNKPLCADEIMQQLQISRGNANINLRALIDWGVVHKKNITGERKDFFVAEKDMWLVMQNIIEHRRKKELDPMIKVLDEISAVQGSCSQSDAFCKVVKELQVYAHKADNALSTLSKGDNSWLVSGFLRMMR